VGDSDYHLGPLYCTQVLCTAVPKKLCTAPEIGCTVHRNCVLYTGLCTVVYRNVYSVHKNCCTRPVHTDVYCIKYCVQYTEFVYSTQYFLIVYCSVQYTITPHFPDDRWEHGQDPRRHGSRSSLLSPLHGRTRHWCPSTNLLMARSACCTLRLRPCYCFCRRSPYTNQ
jgi:hypothetical protein